MQSSGFLDLKSLMALSGTCKAHAFDELSIIQLIENEITRYHGAKTVGEAIDFLKKLWYKVDTPSLKQWLDRDGSHVEAWTIVTRDLLSMAIYYEVMLRKMLQCVPAHWHLRMAEEQDSRDSIASCSAVRQPRIT